MNSPNQDDELIFGRNAVLAFLGHTGSERDKLANDGLAPTKGGLVNKIFMAQGTRPDQRLAEIRRLAKLAGIPLVEVDRRQLDRLVKPADRHQGVVAQLSKVEMLSLSEFFSTWQNQANQTSVVAILDGIEDPQNLGAIVRVAECAGVKAIFLPARRSAGITAAVAKTSAGALASLPIVRIGNIVSALEQLKKLGFWVVGLDVGASQSYFEAKLVGPMAIVIGSEGRGLSRLVSEHCDYLLRIPLFGKTNSLNAAVATGIVFYEAVRQRLVNATEN